MEDVVVSPSEMPSAELIIESRCWLVISPSLYLSLACISALASEQEAEAWSPATVSWTVFTGWQVLSSPCTQRYVGGPGRSRPRPGAVDVISILVSYGQPLQPLCSFTQPYLWYFIITSRLQEKQV